MLPGTVVYWIKVMTIGMQLPTGVSNSILGCQLVCDVGQGLCRPFDAHLMSSHDLRNLL
jgi:hypothetical protein